MAVSAVFVPPPVSFGRARRVAVAGALLVLVAALVSGHIGPGLADVAHRGVSHHEAQRPAATPARAAPHVPAGTTDIADRVLPVRGAPGTLEAVDPSFRAVFDGRGVHYLPAHATRPLSLALATVARGGEAIALRPGRWRGAGTVAERPVAPGVLERATARSGQIEWDVVLASPLRGHGDLAITARLAGGAGAPAITTADGRPALRIPVRGGVDVTMGELVVRDARGTELFRALPAATPETITLRVPARVLDHASYPLTVDPTVSGPVAVAPAASQFAPSIASNGTKWLVVWEVLVAGFYDVYGSVVNADATGTASTPFRISSRAQDEVQPRVAWSQNRFLVVWQHNFSATDLDVRGQLLDGNASLVGGELPISIPSSQQKTPAVGAGLGGFVVSWSDNRDGRFEIYAARIAVDGTQLDPNGFRIDDAPSASYTETVPDVAWNGSKFLIVWQRQFGPLTDGSFSYQVMARVVGADASLGATNAVALFGPNAQPKDPSVAANGSQFLVVWEENTDIVGARVVELAFLYTGEKIQISTAAQTQDDPVVTTNGGDYFVAWRDGRTFPGQPDYDVYGTRVGTDGTVKDSTGIAISHFAANEQAPAVAPGAGGKWGVAYESGNTGAIAINVRLVAPK